MDKSYFEAAGDALSAIRPYLRHINSSQSINDIAMGDICAATAVWRRISSSLQSEEAERYVIDYYIPNEGTNSLVLMMAIPADAKNVDNAYKFVDYMMRADVAAECELCLVCKR